MLSQHPESGAEPSEDKPLDIIEVAAWRGLDLFEADLILALVQLARTVVRCHLALPVLVSLFGLLFTDDLWIDLGRPLIIRDRLPIDDNQAVALLLWHDPQPGLKAAEILDIFFKCVVVFEAGDLLGRQLSASRSELVQGLLIQLKELALLAKFLIALLVLAEEGSFDGDLGLVKHRNGELRLFFRQVVLHPRHHRAPLIISEERGGNELRVLDGLRITHLSRE